MNALQNFQPYFVDSSLDFFQVVNHNGDLYLDECGLSRYFGEFIEQMFLDSNYKPEVLSELEIEDGSVRYYSMQSILDYVDEYNYPDIVHTDVCDLFKCVAEFRTEVDNALNYRYYFDIDFETKYPYLVNSDNFVEVDISTLENLTIIDTYYDDKKNAVEFVCDTGKSYRLQYQSSIKNDNTISKYSKQRCDTIYGNDYTEKYCKDEYQYHYKIDYDLNCLGEINNTSMTMKYENTLRTSCLLTNSNNNTFNFVFTTNNTSKYVSLVEYLPYNEREIEHLKKHKS